MSITRRCSGNEPATYVEKRTDAGSHLRLILCNQSLVITSKPGVGHNRIGLEVSLLPEDIGRGVRDIIRISEGPKKASPGSIWSKVDVSIDRKGMSVKLQFEYQLFWNATPSPANGFRRTDYRRSTQSLIDTFYPTLTQAEPAWSPMDFYEAAFVPAKDDPRPLSIEIPGMDATLFPYQKRTLQWLLKREGVQWSRERGIEPFVEDALAPLSDSSRIVRDVNGREMFLNDIAHTVATDNTPYRAFEKPVKGGILAEEMGLGKTLEILGLILLHTRSRSELLDAKDSDTTRIASGATLIVTPESLRQQWLSEIAQHAPGLRVEFYRGCKRDGGEGDETAKRLANCDVVLTTYTVLSAEIHFANDAPERARRQERKYERPKCPLVQVIWWRLCLDEAQMIENGISQAATVARTIPRINAWGITGTPVKDDVKDLYGLLSFLRYEPLCSAPQLWQPLVQRHKAVFQKLFNTIALRHTKALVRDEITLPPQRRYAISVPFTAVEEQHYQSLYKEMTEACGVDAQGNPVEDDWNPDKYEEDMRTWLNRLRQTALHPEVGAYSRRILGQNRSRPMRTVEEVLDAMLDHSDSTIRGDQRALLSNKLTRGQLFENSPRVKEALVIWEEVRKESDKMVAEARAELEVAIGDQSTREAERRPSRNGDDSADSEDEPEELESRGRVGEIRRRLRTALEMQHKAVFFCANAFFQIRDNKELTTPDSDEFTRLKKLEDEGYEEAKTIRREILRESHRKATKLMNKIARKASGQTFTEVAELNVRSEKGIESARIIDNLEVLYGELNQQANVIDEWRENVVQLLLKSLLDEEDDVETTGEEMGDAAKTQDEMIIHVQALRAAIADRQDAMTGQTNELVNYESQTSIRMAKNGDGPMPDRLLALFEHRAQVKPHIANMSMRGAISELRALTTRLSNEQHQTERVRMELAIAKKHLQETQKALTEQTKAASSLESEIETFRTTMNARLEYYRQLQSVSDSVLPYDGAKTEEALARMTKAEEDLRSKLASAEAKHRYREFFLAMLIHNQRANVVVVLHLKEAGSKTNEPRICIICQTPFETGVLTVCGHQFCKECMMMWFRAHRNCPVCKRHLTSSQLHDITMKPQELRLHGDNSGQSSENQSPRADQNGIDNTTVIYSVFNSEKLAEIKNMELDGPSYTTKVDTLVRHLLWLRQTDPAAKSIGVSQNVPSAHGWL